MAIRATNKPSMKQEFQRAMAEKRQPNCPYCGLPLEVAQVQRDYLLWEWNNATKAYEKTSDGDAEDPACNACHELDSDFLAYDSKVRDLCIKLGLDY